MKRLEDIPKTNIYQVPDGYFERLPSMIQSKIAKAPPATVWGNKGLVVLRWAVAVVLLLAVGIFWWPRANSIEDELAKFDETQLAYFLENTETPTDELIDASTLSLEELDALEEEVFLNLETGFEWEQGEKEIMNDNL